MICYYSENRLKIVRIQHFLKTVDVFRLHLITVEDWRKHAFRVTSRGLYLYCGGATSQRNDGVCRWMSRILWNAAVPVSLTSYPSPPFPFSILFKANDSNSWKRNTERWVAACKTCASSPRRERPRRRIWPVTTTTATTDDGKGASPTRVAALSWPCKIWRRNEHRWKFPKASRKPGQLDCRCLGQVARMVLG